MLLWEGQTHTVQHMCGGQRATPTIRYEPGTRARFSGFMAKCLCLLTILTSSTKFVFKRHNPFTTIKKVHREKVSCCGKNSRWMIFVVVVTPRVPPDIIIFQATSPSLKVLWKRSLIAQNKSFWSTLFSVKPLHYSFLFHFLFPIFPITALPMVSSLQVFHVCNLHCSLESICFPSPQPH